ncbi:hypothetical protein [Streptomyces sp. 846.5]|uniref:hypothetical protein n=1 Tax=Streptacidiphilus sp. EB103A TaxID=3156275 RepID=UPI001063BC14|nr:hypothetical protein [Streptomyces sp. 846.5]TDT98702.1 hypothetical protein EDD99_6933 [Streptomyces sp. 846.5]
MENPDPIVIVLPPETGPDGTGRRVQLGHNIVALAESRADVEKLLEMAGLTEWFELDPTIVEWRLGGPDDWPSEETAPGSSWSSGDSFS